MAEWCWRGHGRVIARNATGCTYLLLPTFIASALHWLSPLVITRIVVIHVLNTPRGAVDPRNGDIAFATLQAIGIGHGDRRMIDPGHYGTGDS